MAFFVAVLGLFLETKAKKGKQQVDDEAQAQCCPGGSWGVSAGIGADPATVRPGSKQQVVAEAHDKEDEPLDEPFEENILTKTALADSPRAYEANFWQQVELSLQPTMPPSSTTRRQKKKRASHQTSNV